MDNLIETSIRRPDSAGKSSGKIAYLDDLSFPGMIYARTVSSERARAKILSVSLPEMPAGYTVVDRRDIGGINRFDKALGDWPILAEDVVQYLGEPILLIAGPDRRILDNLVSKVRITYEDLPIIQTIEEAESCDYPIFGDDNLFADYSITKGHPDRTFSEASSFFEGTYRTGIQEQAYMEPQGMIGMVENNVITVYGSMQCPYYVHHSLMHCFGVPEERVRVVQATTGGAFGGKEDYPSILACHAALAAQVTGKPVKIVYPRSEDMALTPKRHPSRITIRTALDADGAILGHDIDIALDGGAYSGLSAVVLQRALFASCGVYRVDNLSLRGRVMATNTVPKGAFRGFGAPQAFYAMENHMDRLAVHLGIDPADFKRRYFLKQGDTTVTGGTIKHPVYLEAMTDCILERSGYRNKRSHPEPASGGRGIGLSFVFHGCGFTGSGEQEIIKARVTLRKNADGIVDILAANTEMGQGFHTTACKIVAAKLHIPFDRVRYDQPDTSRVPDSGPTVASRSTMIVGGLLAEAAEDLLPHMNEPGEYETERRYRQPPDVVWDQSCFSGDAYPAYSWGVLAVEVDHDPVTCETKILHAWTAYDVGKAMDERILAGQIDGGLIQSLGWASLEVMEEHRGKILQGSFTDYTIPTTLDVPDVDTVLFDNPYERGPFGAKGAGELTFIGGAPAFTAAVRHATGLDPVRIPITPEYLEELYP